MAEEHRCQAPEGHKLCANNCGFFGSTTTMDLCSKCYRDVLLKEQEQAKTKSTIETALSSSSTSAAAHPSPPPPAVDSLPQPSPLIALESSVSTAPAVGSTVHTNRCAACRKRIGLTGFTCRCGITFCGAHRYPEKHGCGFDFKTVGRDEIARANPVIKAQKLDKI
ncbi:zinc finger A20 and AN1 domain-containing stress-associated protein 4-like [Arachis stenosperma]|uniref:zinc finger A20 and AN1 domain-containing stress-associated protein 4-like n=1 Tax=Arachis stenosperma TaxID=217475 RepID=UPI0025AD1167|nr:zinc finger A20 and AN1 domain-containing stress-associated protein 4-like [Arachis stenosperma]